MYNIFADCAITRRKSVCHVFDDTDTLLYSSPRLADCMHWVYHQGHAKLKITGENYELTVSILAYRTVDEQDTLEDHALDKIDELDPVLRQGRT